MKTPLEIGFPMRAFAIALLFFLASCGATRVDVRHADSTELFQATTFAWGADPLLLDSDGEPLGRTDLFETLRKSIENELVGDGMTPAADSSEADVLVYARLSIEDQVVDIDPNFTVDTARVFERAVLRLRMNDRQSGRAIWDGTARRRLRLAKVGFGRSHLRFTDTHDARKWDVPGMAERLVAALELESVRQGRDDGPVVAESR